jgi:hypothetical protein
MLLIHPGSWSHLARRLLRLLLVRVGRNLSLSLRRLLRLDGVLLLLRQVLRVTLGVVRP